MVVLQHKHVRQLHTILQHCDQLSQASNTTVRLLWSSWQPDWAGEAICDQCLIAMTELSALVISELENADVLKVLE